MQWRLFAFAILFVISLTKIENLSCEKVFTFPNHNRVSSRKSILRIVGGQAAGPHQFPYQVVLYVDYKMYNALCSGTLISPNYVLTAAHCAQGAVNMDVILGAHNISDDSEPSRQRQIAKDYVVHPDWDSDTLMNDLALVKLSPPAVINEYVQVIKLASGEDTFAHQIGTVSGWGLTSDSQSAGTDILRFISNTILTNDECKATDSKYENIIQDTHLCLSGVGKKSICDGDSGGPIIANGVQVGVTSFNYKSCEAGKPSVFTRLTRFTQWIEDNSDVTF